VHALAVNDDAVRLLPRAAPRVLVAAAEGGRSVLIEALRAAGVAVLVAPDAGLLQQAESGAVDLVLLHGDLPSTLEQLQALHGGRVVPVLVALRSQDMRGGPVELALAAGADDCVAGRAAPAELVARVHALLRRRGRPVDPQVLHAGPLVLDLARHVFLRHGVPVHLPPKEFGLLELLLRHDGRVVSRALALEVVWGRRSTDDPSTVDVHVKRLRSKVEPDPAHPVRLLTVRGLGYRLQD